MDAGYKILEVNWHGRTAVAVLPLTRVVGCEMSQSLRDDFLRLAESAAESVELDLRTVACTDGSLFTRLLELRGALQKRSAALQLRVSGILKDVMAVTKLDQLLDVMGGSDDRE